MSSPLILDCTQLFNDPVSTGIQRVVRAVIQHRPDNGLQLHVARFHPTTGLVAISDPALDLLRSRFAETGTTVRQLAGQLAALSPPEQPSLPIGAPVLLPEIFYDVTRLDFYSNAITTGSHPVAMLAYDFMPFLQPWNFDTISVHPLMGYLRLLTRATELAFISAQTRGEYTSRIMRDLAAPNAGPTLRLGSDSLNVSKQKWHRGRNSFLCLGTIETRKNLHLVAECFQALWQAGHTARLVVIGHHFGPALPSWLTAIRTHPNFTWIEAASDEQIAAAMQDVRATIFASETEGFGLPPVESLHIGVPVITYAGVPSLEGVPAHGQVRLRNVTVKTLTSAVLSMSEDTTAKAAWTNAGRLKLQGWAAFAQSVADWCEGIADRNRPQPTRRR